MPGLNADTLLPPVMALAKEAGDAILALYDRPTAIAVQSKGDATPVTEADLQAHRLICAGLQRLTPTIPVLSEESPPHSIRDRRRWPCYWLVDPLDGTKEFIKRNGQFTVNIALIQQGQVALGVVHVPVDHTTYGGSPTLGALKREGDGHQRAIHSRRVNPDKTLCVVTSRSHSDPRQEGYIKQLARIAPVKVTPVGSSLKLCLLAEGLADVHVRLGRTCEWDTAAAQGVLEAAGGQLVDLKFNPLKYNQKKDLYNPDFLAMGDVDFAWSEYLRPLD